jgi:hypothetical protein
MGRGLAVVNLAGWINGHGNILVDVLETCVWRNMVGSRRLEWLGMAYLPGRRTKETLARYSRKRFHDRFRAKISNGAQRLGVLSSDLLRIHWHILPTVIASGSRQ